MLGGVGQIMIAWMRKFATLKNIIADQDQPIPIGTSVAKVSNAMKVRVAVGKVVNVTAHWYVAIPIVTLDLLVWTAVQYLALMTMTAVVMNAMQATSSVE